MAFPSFTAHKHTRFIVLFLHAMPWARNHKSVRSAHAILIEVERTARKNLIFPFRCAPRPRRTNTENHHVYSSNNGVAVANKVICVGCKSQITLDGLAARIKNPALAASHFHHQNKGAQVWRMEANRAAQRKWARCAAGRRHAGGFAHHKTLRY